MVHFSPRVRLLLALIALLLLLPVLGMHWQRRTELEQFHNRHLSPSPEGSLLLIEPVTYFKEKKAWLGDRIFPIMWVTRLQKKALYTVFRTAPEPRVTLGKQDFVFLNGGSNSERYKLFEQACQTAHATTTANRLMDALAPLAAAMRSAQVHADVMIVPTLATLYGDKLPGSVPTDLRQSCQAASAGRSQLFSVQQRYPDLLVYPMQAMHALRDDPAFYPRANWHAQGRSIQVVRDTYLQRITPDPVRGEVLQPTTTFSEILASYEIKQPQPQYVINNPSVQIDDAENAQLARTTARFFGGSDHNTLVVRNSSPLLAQNVLMLSDSFGTANALAFGGAFAHVYQINTNNMDDTQVPDLAVEVMRARKIDRVVLLIQEGNTRRLLTWLNALFQSPRSAGFVAALQGQ